MAEYMIQSGTLADIADAIREKTGVTAAMFPRQMPDYIRGIAASGETIPADIAYEAVRVVDGMREKLASNAVTFLAIADMHQPGDGDISDETAAALYREASRSAGQGAALIANLMELDFTANLGDLAFGAGDTTIPAGIGAILSARADTETLEDQALSIRTPGSHDPLTCSYTQNGAFLTAEVLAGLIGTYGYHDLEEKKVRIICLNTADNQGATVESDGETQRISGEQLRWFAETLDLSGKSDGDQWQILLLAHHPLDWGEIRPAGNCLAAYLAGERYSATHNGVEVSYDFSGKNVAGVIAQFHGHTHCLKVDYIHDFRTGSPVETLVKRVAIPNACFDQNNMYGTTEIHDLIFGEETTYGKSGDSAGKNTAFCLVSVDLDQKVIYADCFGAGCDRIIGYGETEEDRGELINLVLTSINILGDVFNGCGYLMDYRLGASGTETESSGAIVSGFIANTGKTLRIWGASDSTVGLTGNYVAFYDSEFTAKRVVSFAALAECGGVWEALDGKYMLTVDPTALTSDIYRTLFLEAQYLRCSLAEIGDAADFVVTLGRKITLE